MRCRSVGCQELSHLGPDSLLVSFSNPKGFKQASVLSFHLPICLRPERDRGAVLYIILFQETLKFIGHKLCTVEMFSTTAVTYGTENLLQTFNDFSGCHGRQNIHFEMSALIINLDKYIFS